MRVLIRSYDIADLGGSGVSLRTTADFLASEGDTVWSTAAAESVDTIRERAPDVIVGQQWATEEASRWAISLRKPFVMFVHGPGQYEHFWPQCDLVVFNAESQRVLAAAALGATPWHVLPPPVLRADYATDSQGTHVTLIGSGHVKGVDRFLALACAMPEASFLWVTDEPEPDLPPNVEVHPRRLDMRPIYARTRLLVMPSRVESYGRVAIEAAMSGIPVVAADTPGLRESTAGHARLVGDGEDWEAAVRGVLADIEPHQRAARALADLRDPTAGLMAFREQLCSIAAAGRRRPTLSLCMTVANEAATLAAAVASVSDVVDAVIIGVDTRSSDETDAIAQSVANDCFSYTESSPPDFRRMRNRAMERVTTDWAIVLDGHEWIENAHLIRPALETTAWSIEIQTLYEPDESRIPGLAFPFPRIHRRHVRFTGPAAHEEIAVPLDRRVSCPEIKVWHERKPGAASATRGAEKSGAELDVLRAAWERDADRRALFYLANGLRDAGRIAEAIEAYLLYLAAPSFPEEGWQAELYLGRCHAAQHAWSDARRVFEQAILAAPDRAEPMIALGHTLLALGNDRHAAAWFRLATSLPQPTHYRLFVEVPAYRWHAWHGLAIALDRLGDVDGAIGAESEARARGAGAWADANIARWKAARSASRD